MRNVFSQEYENINLKPLSGALGAEIVGIDFNKISKDELAEVQHAYINYHLIVIRNQVLSPDDFVAIGNRMGDLVRLPSSFSASDYLDILEVENNDNKDPYYPFNQWSSDLSFLRTPASASIAYCIDCEGFGGESVFASQSLAYASLSQTTQSILDNLKAVHSFNADNPGDNYPLTTSRGYNIHPVIRTLDDTGLKAIFVNPMFTRKIFGMKEAESNMLLNFLYDHVTQEAFTCRLIWEKNTLAIWDNRCLQHFNLFSRKSGLRKILKSLMLGNKPY